MVLFPLICSGQLFNIEKLTAGCLGFLAFSFLSSIVYIINDINDREKDRLHPKKCKRPIAAGTITVTHAICLVFILAIAVIACNFVVWDWKSSVLLVTYFLLNYLYSIGLKNIPLLDLAILVSGFVIRVIYGAMVTDIVISNWLYLTIFAMAFYFALGKRRNEAVKITNGETRAVLKAYPITFLDKNMNMCLTLANVFYALWCMDQNTVMSYDSKYLIFTVPVVLLITLKYSMNIEGDSDGDPVEVLLSDKILIAMCLIYFCIMFTVLYLV